MLFSTLDEDGSHPRIFGTVLPVPGPCVDVRILRNPFFKFGEVPNQDTSLTIRHWLSLRDRRAASRAWMGPHESPFFPFNVEEE